MEVWVREGTQILKILMTVVKRVVVSTESEEHNGFKKASYEASMNKNEEGINSSNATAHFF